MRTNKIQLIGDKHDHRFKFAPLWYQDEPALSLNAEELKKLYPKEYDSYEEFEEMRKAS